MVKIISITSFGCNKWYHDLPWDFFYITSNLFPRACYEKFVPMFGIEEKVSIVLRHVCFHQVMGFFRIRINDKVVTSLEKIILPLCVDEMIDRNIPMIFINSCVVYICLLSFKLYIYPEDDRHFCRKLQFCSWNSPRLSNSKIHYEKIVV